MSADVFISYRHGATDSWVAGRLYDALESEFAVYFDTSRKSNDFGDDFARGIDDALSTCRVVFAIIGPNWISPEAMDRIRQPNDWVRHELKVALARPDRIRVVPLFVELDGTPDFSRLPGDLEALARKNARTLNRNLWESESQELIARLRSEWLVVKRGAPRTTVDLPPVLPFLCDRREQEDRLIELVQTRARTTSISCVVHGHKWEAHDEFLDRLRYQGALEDILLAADVGLALYAIQLSRDRIREGRFRDALISALKAATRRRSVSDAELQSFLTRLPQPVVAVAQLTASDIADSGSAVVEGLVEAWRELLQPETGTDLPATRYPALMWINVTYDDLDAELKSALPSILPKLQPVEGVHVREWLGLDQVKERVAHKKTALEDLVDHPRYFLTPGKVHMRRFAEGVRDILSEM